MAKVICVSGGLGCGKTTLLTKLNDIFKDKKVLLMIDVLTGSLKEAGVDVASLNFVDRQRIILEYLVNSIEEAKIRTDYDIVIYDRSPIDYLDASGSHYSQDLRDLAVEQDYAVRSLRNTLHLIAPTPPLSFMRKNSDVFLKGDRKRVDFVLEMSGLKDASLCDEIILEVMHDQMVRSEERIKFFFNQIGHGLLDYGHMRVSYIRSIIDPSSYFEWQDHMLRAATAWILDEEHADRVREKSREYVRQNISEELGKLQESVRFAKVDN